MYIIKLNLGNIYAQKSESSNFVISKLGVITRESNGVVARLHWRKFFSVLRTGARVSISGDLNKRVSLYLSFSMFGGLVDVKWFEVAYLQFWIDKIPYLKEFFSFNIFIRGYILGLAFVVLLGFIGFIFSYIFKLFYKLVQPNLVRIYRNARILLLSGIISLSLRALVALVHFLYNRVVDLMYAYFLFITKSANDVTWAKSCYLTLPFGTYFVIWLLVLFVVIAGFKCIDEWYKSVILCRFVFNYKSIMHRLMQRNMVLSCDQLFFQVDNYRPGEIERFTVVWWTFMGKFLWASFFIGILPFVLNFSGFMFIGLFMLSLNLNSLYILSLLSNEKSWLMNLQDLNHIYLKKSLEYVQNNLFFYLEELPEVAKLESKPEEAIINVLASGMNTEGLEGVATRDELLLAKDNSKAALIFYVTNLPFQNFATYFMMAALKNIDMYNLVMRSVSFKRFVEDGPFGGNTALRIYNVAAAIAGAGSDIPFGSGSGTPYEPLPKSKPPTNITHIHNHNYPTKHYITECMQMAIDSYMKSTPRSKHHITAGLIIGSTASVGTVGYNYYKNTPSQLAEQQHELAEKAKANEAARKADYVKMKTDYVKAQTEYVKVQAELARANNKTFLSTVAELWKPKDGDKKN